MNVQAKPLSEITRHAIDLLSKEMGIVDTVRFLNQFTTGYGDYTEEREDHARMQLGLERILADGGYGAYSTHFGAVAEDGRFAWLLGDKTTSYTPGPGTFVLPATALRAGILLCDPCPARGLRTTSCPSGPGRRRPGPPGHR
jgi:hypothetical protein